ncbi:MAG: NAD-dependent epimerase/dehydratase family protein [Acidimicrobiia bacterium]
MRILIVGGTRFVGRHIVHAALRAGHEVTLFNRGRSGSDLFPDVPHLTGDRDGDLSALASSEWDATVDTCAYVPRQVHALADALGERGGQMVFISSVSVYGAPTIGYDEQSPLIELGDPTVETITNDTYGGLKVLSERAATERFGADTLLVRPTYVVGPDDHTYRFPWWVSRLARGGEVLAPGPADDPAQVIDARDMATWIVSMIERRAPGVFHTVGPEQPITWGQLLETIAAQVAPPGTALSWVPASLLREEGLDGMTLPLWAGDEPDALMSAASPAAALAAGLRIRPLSETIADTLEWTRTHDRPAHIGLDPKREAAILERWRAAR